GVGEHEPDDRRRPGAVRVGGGDEAVGFGAGQAHGGGVVFVDVRACLGDRRVVGYQRLVVFGGVVDQVGVPGRDDGQAAGDAAPGGRLPRSAGPVFALPCDPLVGVHHARLERVDAAFLAPGEPVGEVAFVGGAGVAGL